MEDLANYNRQQMERNSRNYQEPRMGLVTAWDGNAIAAKVKIQPEDFESGWLPVGVDWMGNGWGFIAPLAEGDQVLVVFQEGDRDSGIIVKRIFDQRNPPPGAAAGAESGELWLVHKSGSMLKLTNDTNVTIISAGDLDVTVSGAVNLTVTGDVSVAAQGDVNVTAQGDANVTAQGNAAITGATVLLGGGGKKVVLDGDSVVAGKVVASSTKVKAT
jgi:phage baseplate assembly protein V